MQARTYQSRLVLGRNGFTVVEVLVSVAIIAVLAALLIPAVGAVREAARRTQCSSNLRQIGIAMGAYESTHRMYPPGGGFGASMHVFLLPYVDQQPLYEKYDFIKRDGSGVQTTAVSLYICPSDAAADWPTPPSDGRKSTNYAGNSGTGVLKYGYNGMFRHLVYGAVRPADVAHGLSNTAAVCEILRSEDSWSRLRVNWQTPRIYYTAGQLDAFAAVCSGIPPAPRDFGWVGDQYSRGSPWSRGEIGFTMYNHVLGPNQPSCTNGALLQTAIISAGSAHHGGVNLLFADGHLAFIADSVDQQLWKGMGSRVGSDVLASN